ncbi:MAG: adenylosuccinate lyase [Deltaproteobacteria bacterium]|nr:adenylosuccinate lyase [Deltaproteobacteria bacterium]
MIPRYSRPAMTAVWSDRMRYETWLEVELAACEAMEDAGTVPRGTAEAVRAKARLDEKRILEIEEQTRHDVIAFLTHVEELAGEPARHLHRGMTSSDVLDTALALQLDRASRLIDEGLVELRGAAREQALRHKVLPMIGRTHGIHAEPITLGLVFAGWYAELGRARARFRAAWDEIKTGKLAGAVGTYAHLSPELEAAALGKLGLRPETVPTQIVQRDRHAAYLGALALVAAAVERIALAVRHWQRTEVREVEEPFGKGQRGSSAMPHKRNPILSENLCGLSRLVRAYAGAGLENVALWHERDISHSSVERVALADAATLVDFMLRRAAGLVRGLVVHEDRIRANLESTRGLVYSEGLLLALVDAGTPRQEAYGYVQRAAMRVWDEGLAFADAARASAEIARRLPAKTIDELFDPAHVLRHAAAIVERALGEVDE